MSSMGTGRGHGVLKPHSNLKVPQLSVKKDHGRPHIPTTPAEPESLSPGSIYEAWSACNYDKWVLSELFVQALRLSASMLWTRLCFSQKPGNGSFPWRELPFKSNCYVRYHNEQNAVFVVAKTTANIKNENRNTKNLYLDSQDYFVGLILSHFHSSDVLPYLWLT